MSASFNATDPSSPLYYPPNQTALLLLDYHGFIISQLAEAGTAALATAARMRTWALENGITVVHCLVDVHATPSVICKGGPRVTAMLEGLKDDREAVDEPASAAFSGQRGEFVVRKQPGIISGLRSPGAMELLSERGIKSLIICGLSTSGAVLRTAIPATDDGFVVSVISDACADRKEGVHEMVLETLLPNRAHVTNADEFIGEWEKASGRGRS
ncbi:hypothetical protein LTS02_003590 [Friedmanniomyces endolithicus]|nr:hypothetical protein LTS02_003590 [Friedmanniomyces endolithicus]KAK0868846.1 hypothetical protein LTR87_013969 [Friedmanniomyces endolithicus]